MPRSGRPPVERTVVFCEACGAEIERRLSEVKRNTSQRFFCDAKCRNVVGSKPRRGEPRQCGREGCERTFYRQPSSPQMYCSRACKDIASRVAVLLFVCEHCGSEFQVVPGLAKYNANRFCSKACEGASRTQASLGKTYRTSDGYIVVFEPDHPCAQPSTGRVMQHVKVVADTLGRPLQPNENVHHKNGKRDDNRPQNLELWVSSQPSGQQPAHLVAWAREILDRYAAEVEEHPTLMGVGNN